MGDGVPLDPPPPVPEVPLLLRREDQRLERIIPDEPVGDGLRRVRPVLRLILARCGLHGVGFDAQPAAFRPDDRALRDDPSVLPDRMDLAHDHPPSSWRRGEWPHRAIAGARPPGHGSGGRAIPDVFIDHRLYHNEPSGGRPGPCIPRRPPGAVHSPAGRVSSRWRPGGSRNRRVIRPGPGPRTLATPPADPLRPPPGPRAVGPGAPEPVRADPARAGSAGAAARVGAGDRPSGPRARSVRTDGGPDRPGRPGDPTGGRQKRRNNTDSGHTARIADSSVYQTPCIKGTKGYHTEKTHTPRVVSHYGRRWIIAPIPYAHTLPGQPRTEWHPLKKHLEDTAGRAKGFATAFGSGEWGHLAGLWHDLGKYSDAFQNHLSESAGSDDVTHKSEMTGRVDHST